MYHLFRRPSSPARLSLLKNMPDQLHGHERHAAHTRTRLLLRTSGSEAMLQAAPSTKSKNLSAAKFLFTVNFVVLTHSFHFSVLSLFSPSLQLPLLPHALLRTQLTRQDLLLTRSAGDLLQSSTCLSHQRLIARFSLLYSLSPQQLIPYYYLLHSHSAGDNLYIM